MWRCPLIPLSTTDWRSQSVRVPSSKAVASIRLRPECPGYGEAGSVVPMTLEPLLRVHLFEPLHMQLGDHAPIGDDYPRRKAKALFVYLYLNRGRWISKYQLLAELWPESEHADPGRVKHTVQILRSALEGPRPAGGWQVVLERGGAYAFNS